jgi:hypothetical protein
MTGRFEILRFRIDVITHKIQNTSLFIIQSLSNLIATKNSEEEIRSFVKKLQTDTKAQDMFIRTLQYKYENIERLLFLCVSLYQKVMGCEDGLNEEDFITGDILNRVFVHFLKFVYVNPRLILIHKRLTLCQSVEMISAAWKDFIICQIRLFRPTLTSESIKSHNDVRMITIPPSKDLSAGRPNVSGSNAVSDI